MSRRSMIEIDSIISLEKKHSLNIPFETLESATVMYEEGMNQVLREIVGRHLKVCDGFEIEKSEEYKRQRDKREDIFDQLLSEIRDEKTKDLLRELSSEEGFLALIQMDGAYTEGFLAGYRFLKELHPD